MVPNHPKKTKPRYLMVAGALSLSLLTQHSLAQLEKHIAVPAEDAGNQRLSNADQTGLHSHSTMIEVSELQANVKSLNASDSQLVVSKKIFIDGAQDSPIMLLGPDAEQWHISLSDPKGNMVHDGWENPQSRIATQQLSIGDSSFTGKKYTLRAPETGVWEIKLTRKINQKQQAFSVSSAGNVAADQSLRQAYLYVKGDDQYQLYSYLDNKMSTQNSDINIVAYMVKANKNTTSREQLISEKPIQGVINNAVAHITTPSEKTVTVPLNDSGLHGDKLAGDGIYSGKIPTDETGIYTSSVHVEGTRPDGIRYSRTTTDLYPVEKKTYRFKSKSAKLIKTRANNAVISVPIKRLAKVEPIFMAGEVWGRATTGEMKLAAWVGGIVSPINKKRNTRLKLNFDTRWLQRERLQAPFELRNLRLQTVDTNTPIAMLDSKRLTISKRFNRRLKKQINNNNVMRISAKAPITKEMLMGRAPPAFTDAAAFSTSNVGAAAGAKLMLVHGYCSGPVWNQNDFSNSIVFVDRKQNRTHDAFAKRIQAFGKSYGAYSVVAHSQGGAAALHLLAKYWSGFDQLTSGGQKIQSVGTPYQGTAIAGNIAAIGKIFGVKCGKNYNMTYSGAANWLSTIPSWARNGVDYYTTSYYDGPSWFDHCHLASDVLLRDPEDGTTEMWSGQLPGGINKGHKVGWCHSTGMRDPAQYHDKSRNAQMNRNAAR